MAFQKGKSGNPGGRGKDKPWADALRMVGYRDNRKRLLAIAEQCYAAAEAGEIAAMREIGDRLDGKPVQESEVTVHRSVAELTDEQIAARIAELRGAGTPDGDSAAPLDPSQLN
jgi:hypothetical protein